MIYENFDLEIISPQGDGALCARVLESPQGDCPFISVKWPFDAEQENELLSEIYGGLRQRRAQVNRANLIQDFGGKLFEAVFSGDIEHLFRSSLDSAFRTGKGLRIRLRLPEDSELHARPWEFLFDTESREFLAVREHTPLVRYLPVAQRMPPITVEGPLRVLVALSSPTDHPRLDIAREWEILRQALAPSVITGRLELRRVPGRCTFDNLRDSLRHFGAHIFHFVGHGIPGALVLEQESGKGLEMEATHLRSAFPSGALPRLIVLNACSGAITQDVPFSGLAQGFLRQGVPAVVAMQASITDDAALIFTRYFYRDLVEIGAVDTSLTEARLRMQGNGHPVEWGTPVLYMRALSGQLFQPATNPDPSPSERKKPGEPQGRADAPAVRVEPSLNVRKKTREVQAKQDVPPLQPEASPAERKRPRTARARDNAPQPTPGPDPDVQNLLKTSQAKAFTPPLKPEPEVTAPDIPPGEPPGRAAAPFKPEPAGQDIAANIQAQEPTPPPMPEPHPAEQDNPPKVQVWEFTKVPTPQPEPAGPDIPPAQRAEPMPKPNPSAKTIRPKVQVKKHTPSPKPEPEPAEPELRPVQESLPDTQEEIPADVQPRESGPVFSLEPEVDAPTIPADARAPQFAASVQEKGAAPAARSRRFLVAGSAAVLLVAVLVMTVGRDKVPSSRDDTPAPVTPASETGTTPVSTAAPASSARPDTVPAPTLTPPSSLSANTAPPNVDGYGSQLGQARDTQTTVPALKSKPVVPAPRKAQSKPKSAPAAVANDCKNREASERPAACLFSGQ
jgi:hypothetical protein